MRFAKRFLPSAVTIATVAMIIAMGVSMGQAATLTAGQFAAFLVNFGNNGTPVSESEAVNKLVKLGVPLGKPNAPLTEVQLAKIMGAFGVRAGTDNPKGFVDDALANYAASILSTTSLFQTGQETSKDHPRTSETDLQACLSARNPGQCVNCCMDQLKAGKACQSFCQDLVPPSPSGP